MKTVPVSIIIVTWNALEYTQRCLKSLLALTNHPDFEIVISDNGSTDGTVEFVRRFPNLRLIENGKNLGFVGGNNAAIATIAAIAILSCSIPIRKSISGLAADLASHGLFE